MAAPNLPPLPARLTHLEADAFVRRCQDVVVAAAEDSAGTVWCIDARALQVFDSSVLAALLAVARLAHRRGARLKVQSMPDRLRALATLYGVSELLPA